ncbi:hypothetical protein JCM8208_007855 [Rhodotorula glutinis]
MSAPHDPTNAHAVAGPSRVPHTHHAPPRQASGARSTSSHPAPPSTHSASSGAGPPPARRPPPTRRADGPLIVSTVIAADGVREVPGAFEHCEVDDLITLIASMLDKLREHNDRIPLTPNSLTRFHSRAPPNISVRDYLVRIAKFTNVEACCLLILLPYVDKVCARLPTFTVSSLTVHRFIIAAISVGSKALSDAFCTNGRYARVGGVSVVEMNLLEKEFCEALDWRLTTSGPVLAHYYTSLVNAHPQYRLSTAPLPTPPPPPAIEIPPPASPLDPLSPVALANPPPSLFTVMDVDVDSSAAAAAAAHSPSSKGAPSAAPVDRSSPSTPSPSPGPTYSSASSSDVSPSSGSALSTSVPHSLANSPERHRAQRGRAVERSPAGVAGAGAGAGAGAPPPQGPPLVRPAFRAAASASNLPSPARGAGGLPPPPSGVHGSALGLALATGAPAHSRAASAGGRTGAAAAGGAGAGAGEGMVAPLSPAKRPRGDSPAGAGAAAAAGAGSSAIALPRFLPSPRLSGAGAETAAAGRRGVEAVMGEEAP